MQLSLLTSIYFKEKKIKPKLKSVDMQVAEQNNKHKCTDSYPQDNRTY